MAEKKQVFGLFHRGDKEPLLQGPDADMLQRTRKREYGNNRDYKVAAMSRKGPTFAELPEQATNKAGLEQRKAEIREKIQNEKLEDELRGEVESDVEESVEESLEEAEEDEESADADDDDTGAAPA